MIKINSPGELYEVFEKGSTVTENIIVQEWIKGGDSSLYSCIFYYDTNCERQVVFTSRKLRQWYTENGDACLAEECRNDTVAAITAELLGKVRFSGLGSVEFKLDEPDGKYYIIEPNIGRPVTRIGLVEASGVPILYTMYCDASGLPLPPNPGQSYNGVKWISLHRDIQAARQYYKEGRLTIRDWLKSLCGVKSFAVLSIRDPLPFLTIIYDALTGLFRPRKNEQNGR